MAKAVVVVSLCYDVISPYSYIAFENFTKLYKKYKNHFDLQLQPVFLGGIMHASKNTPPGMVPAKAKYMTIDLQRLSNYYKIPFQFPKDIGQVMFSKGSLACQRLLVATKLNFPQYLEALTRELFLRVWVKDLDVVSLESLQEACKDANIPNQDANTIISLVKTTEVKEKLKNFTKIALDHGAFGVPSFIAYLDDGPELFFGTDRMRMLVHKLQLPLSNEFYL